MKSKILIMIIIVLSVCACFGCTKHGPKEPTVNDNMISDIYPVPVFSELKGEESIVIRTLSLSGEADKYKDVFTKYGFKIKKDGLPVSILVGGFSEEEYTLDVNADKIEIKAGSDRGAYYAIMTLYQLASNNRYVIYPISVSDAPKTELRGVIEGFYGTAWTHEFRMNLMNFMGENKLNTYIYAPKDDLKHRSEWRKLYTDGELKTLKELVDAAVSSRVDFVYAISPGIDIKLGSGYDKDFETLCKKCEQLYGLGVRDFAIFLDDIATLSAEGHAKLLNDFQTEFIKKHDGVSDLICITTEYADSMMTKYTQNVAPLLNKELRLMWTGPGVISEKITSENMTAIENLFGRRMLIWWNYPVNDTQFDQLYLGPCEGLDTDLCEHIAGLTSNPMNQGNASLIPLFTIADYLWNPVKYDKNASIRASVRAFDIEHAEELFTFVNATCAGILNQNKSQDAIDEYIKQYKKDGYSEELCDKLISEAKKIENVINLKDCKNQEFFKETEGWIRKTSAFGTVIRCYFEAEKAYKTNNYSVIPALAHECSTAYNEYAKDTSYSVSPDILLRFIEKYYPLMNEFCGLPGTEIAESVGDFSVSTNMPTYENYVIGNITEDTDSFFWSAGHVHNGDYVEIDLGAQAVIHSVTLNTGVSGHTADYMNKADIRVSADGKKWKNVGKSKKGSCVIDDVEYTGRYVRIIATGDQAEWFTMSYFGVDCDYVPVGEMNFTSDIPDLPDNMLLKLSDGYAISSFVGNKDAVNGHFLEADVSGFDFVKILSACPGDNTDVVLTDASGNTLSTVKLSNITEIDASSAARIRISFGKESSYIVINEIIVNSQS